MKIEKFNDSKKEAILKNELQSFTKAYLIELILYHGCVENTANKIISDFAANGTVYNNLKEILK